MCFFCLWHFSNFWPIAYLLNHWTNFKHSNRFVLSPKSSIRKYQLFWLFSQLKNSMWHCYLEAICVPWALNTRTYIKCLWQWAGWPILVCSPTQEPSLATAKTRKTWKKFWSQTEVNPTQKVEISKEKIADMHGFILTYSMLQRRDLWALGSRNFEKKNWEKRTGFKLRKKQTNN